MKKNSDDDEKLPAYVFFCPGICINISPFFSLFVSLPKRNRRRRFFRRLIFCLMADEEKEREETSSRGNDWEVVSLTASAYAAAPGPKVLDAAEEGKDKEFNSDEQEASRAMFMSAHFVFPHSEHENLPPEPEYRKILTETDVQDLGSKEKEVDGPDKTQEENWNVKGLSEVEELDGIQFFDKGKKLCVRGMEFEEGKALQGLNLVGEEHCIYGAPGFSSFRTEADISGSIPCDEGTGIAEHGETSPQSLGSPSKTVKPIEENKYNGSGLPCEAWWKRQAASFYAHAKESNSFWSIFVAAALMGLVILGQRWQQERCQVQQLKLHFSINDQKISRMMGPISRFKEMLIGGHGHAPVIRGSSFADL